MVHLRESPVDTAEAHTLLAEYFGARADIFPGGGYRTVFPDPAAFVPPRGVFVVLEQEGAGETAQAVGCGGIRRIDDGDLGMRYELKHLYVKPEGRGKGWGRMLLDDLEARARAFGAAELVLDTHHTLEAAGSLYAHSGFAAIAPYNDNANATRWYGKSL
ncbi:MAG: PadR family transcriptional regulator [Microbacterium sp.]|uniref:GNAT family N-acetyltransferase n=1 Tax=unclassified Microbacterium TaxID=2609290 RepID=UPI000DB73310|nr:GNAT family N-acetyltransferase [Microbacterium sp.]PZU40729.1 MAG: PadR family transcriptional regulator [Microbacterium sp.]